MTNSIVDAIAKTCDLLSNSPKIKDLPPDIRSLAIQNIKDQKKVVDLEKGIYGSFSMIDSKEGPCFWYEVLNRRYDEALKQSIPKTHTPQVCPTGPDDLKNGEEVEAREDGDITWKKGGFIGMNRELYVVAIEDDIRHIQHCRRLEKDKNAFVEGLRPNELEEVSEKLFGDRLAIQILSGLTPTDRQDLHNRAFFVNSSYKVEIGRASAGTFISIHHK